MKNSYRYSSNDYSSLILDASVIISLHKSDYGEKIIQALPFALSTTYEVRNELEKGRNKGHETHEFLNKELNSNNVELIELTAEEMDLRRKLEASNSNSTAIDKGEASIIAVCKFRSVKNRCLPIIDDKKGRKKAKELMNGLDCGRTLDLFLHPKVMTEIGKVRVVEALCTAFKNAEMIVSKDCCSEFVNDFIGKNVHKNAIL